MGGPYQEQKQEQMPYQQNAPYQKGQPAHAVKEPGRDGMYHRIIDRAVDFFGPGTVLLCIVLGALVMARKFLRTWFADDKRFWRRK